MPRSNAPGSLIGALIVFPGLLFNGTAFAAPQLMEHWEPLSAVRNLDVATTSLPKAIAVIEAKTHGKVMNIRFEDDGSGRPVYEAVVVEPHAVGLARFYAGTGKVSGITDDQTPDRTLKWEQLGDVKSFGKATTPLAKAVATVEQIAGAPAINAGLAKRLTLTDNVLAYNIEVLRNGQAERIAVDANSDEVIADPGALGLGDADPGDFLDTPSE
jgi:uncharacterized membrane protein YkoI